MSPLTHRLRPALGTALAVAAAGLAAAPASAHTEVASTSPSSSKPAPTTTRTVTVTFSGQIRRGQIRVVGPRGEVVSAGRGGRDPRNVKRLRVGLKRALKAGRYTARWTMVAADGHTQKGSFHFRLRSR